MSTFVLWDIDGTLIRNTPQAGTLYVDSIEQVTGIRPTTRVPNPHGMTEGQLLAAILDVNELDPGALPAVLERLDELSRIQHEAGYQREACVGASEALRAVAARGWSNALLTGNGPTRARFKLIAAGFDSNAFDWSHSFFGHLSPTRHHLTSDARTALPADSAIIVGDTPKDGEAADSAGIPFIAVATGAYDAEALRSTSALVVLTDLASGLEQLLAAVDQSIGEESARK